MALLKIFTKNDGINTSYWKIASINSVFISNKIEIVFIGYLNEVTRRKTGSLPIEGSKKLYELTTALFPGEVTRKDIYNYIKALPEWSGYQDV